MAVGLRSNISKHRPPPLLLGLTGNIGCGKSTVGQLLATQRGAEYVDADKLVHELYRPGTPQTAAIAKRFGSSLLQADGTIDRRRLGDIVMADTVARADLEALLHPGVFELLRQRISSTRARVVVIDAIKLIEAGLADDCDVVWVVLCDREHQLQRLQETRGLTAEQAALRIDAQGSQEEKAQRADVVIVNNGTIDDLVARVSEAWAETVEPRLSSSVWDGTATTSP